MNEIPFYDNWKLDTPDNHVKVKGTCKQCELDVYEGESFVEEEYNLFHTDCWIDFLESEVGEE